ncbi:homeobox-domain-containing protein [Fomitiporia mediterranea MF3/22]|uniref:homeobox-domain-containing protein n=1 Tax=Fomitiporia mediterranea (strain MF3/22) TaxID=694068 RepID=UPI000440955D|nr:homeobox-domain-containing protein [Fomitiporia mediterranea MF3/22]EJD03516.1 homeobox-domain-containing protein [Fomitiporia mediterranea MF3/22]
MSRPSISRTCSLSSTSSFSSLSELTGEADNETQPTASQSSETKRTRKRFSQDQLVVLEQAYHKSSHPTRDEREEIAKQTDMSVKSVTIWFQNKRQMERKMALNNSLSHNAPLPLAMYPIQQSTQQVSVTDPLSRSNSALLHPSASQPKNKHRLPSRTASGFLSLDRVASRTERVPRTPTKLIRHVSVHESRSRSPEALWESMLSSPIQPEGNDKPSNSHPESPSARDLLDFASTRNARRGSRSKGRRSLEWACAAARMTVDKDDEDTELDEPLSRPSSVFIDTDEARSIDDDASTEIIDTEMESIVDSHEAITPDASHNDFTYQPSTTQVLDNPGDDRTTLDDENTVRMALDKTKHVGDDDMDNDKETLDAALALCGLSTLRG